MTFRGWGGPEHTGLKGGFVVTDAVERSTNHEGNVRPRLPLATFADVTGSLTLTIRHIDNDDPRRKERFTNPYVVREGRFQ